ncbi:hypothetical protein Tco_0997355 [Tanacetum coccineum]
MEFLEKRRKFFVAKRAEEKRNKPPTKAQQRKIIGKLKESKVEGSSKRAGEELEQEKAKKQKIEDEKESEELKQCLEIIPDDGDDVTIDATPLSSKSLTIVDYKIHKEGKKNYFKIFRADARFEKTMPVDYMDNFLLHTLKTMFEHHVEDNVWKNQQELAKVKNWKLFDSCGVHCLVLSVQKVSAARGSYYCWYKINAV